MLTGMQAKNAVQIALDPAGIRDVEEVGAGEKSR